MARVAVCSIMYLGDVAPFLAVARELGRRGHDVVGIFPEGFRPLAEGASRRRPPCAVRRAVAGAVQRVLDGAEFARHAADLAKKMEGEDGASACADTVDAMLA